jgi:MarR family transcriptional regulator, lower aerobic nicotinate degradation pathway regulator
LKSSSRLSAYQSQAEEPVISREIAQEAARQAAQEAARELVGELPAVLTDDVGYLLARAGGRAIRDLNRALQGYGLRSRHYTVLLVAADAGGLSQRDLSAVLGLDPSAVVAIVDDLARAGLVRRDPHPDDRRTRLVVVTDSGRARVEECQALALGVGDALQAGLSLQERAVLLDLLQRVAAADPA